MPPTRPRAAATFTKGARGNQVGDLLKIANCDDKARVADVVFVHGLDGDARTTWQQSSTEPNTFWPAWLSGDFPTIGVWSLGYEVASSAWKGHAMPLVGRPWGFPKRCFPKPQVSAKCTWLIHPWTVASNSPKSARCVPLPTRLLVPKLQLGNPGREAPASRLARGARDPVGSSFMRFKIPTWALIPVSSGLRNRVPKLELGNQ